MTDCLQYRNKSLHQHKTALWTFIYNAFERQVFLILKTSVLTGITIFKGCKNTQMFHIQYLYTRHLKQQIAIIWENLLFLLCHSDIKSGGMEICSMRMKMLWKICDFTICHTENMGNYIKYCRYVSSEILKIMLLTNKNWISKKKIKVKITNFNRCLRKLSH